MRLFTKLQKLWRTERGAVAVITAVALTGLVALTGAAVDLGVVYSARSELQNATDAAAMAGAAELVSDTNGDQIVETNYSGARDSAIGFVESNTMVTEGLVWNEEIDLYEAGLWDFDLDDFSKLGDSADPDDLNAVRVSMQRPVNMLFAKVVGLDQVQVGVSSTAFLGCAGSGGKADLPIAINDDVLDSLGPNDDIVLNSENEENGQWTSFFTWPTNKNTIDYYMDNPDEIPQLNVGDEIAMNNGEITPLFGSLEALFEENKGPDGTWHVMLPVVDWEPPQNEGTVVGFVSFVITEVVGPGGPDSKKIVGYWDNDHQLEAPGAVGNGACYGVRAGRATLIR